MATWHSEILITTTPLQSRPNIWNGAAGASVDFWGVVRALEDGREISGIEYEAHQAMAQHQMEMIAQRRGPSSVWRKFILQHRIGFVAAGEASLFPARGECASRRRLSRQRLDRGRVEAKSADLEAAAFR